MANVLVTGAFGNLGSYVIAELLRQGHAVRCFDVRPQTRKKKAAHFPGLVEVAWGDIRNEKLIRQVAQGQEVILHLAAIIPPASDENPDLTRSVNIEGARNLLEAAKAPENPTPFFLCVYF